METARVAFERTQRLFSDHLASQSDLDTARGNYESVQGQFDAALANVDSAKSSFWRNPLSSNSPRPTSDTRRSTRRSTE